jgi:putative Mg2+ transporter-C (MgtC) family protein
MAGYSSWEIIGRLLLAAALGGVLGLGREIDGQDAGFRTHLLVVLGSALFGVTSVGGFDQFAGGAQDVTVDVTRMAAYVAPGIGFIGGGAILKYGGQVKGITTAASLWSAAAIGVAVGVGFWVAAISTTLIALVALEVLQPVSRSANALGRRRRAALSLDLDPGVELAEVIGAIRNATDGRIRSLRYGVGPDSGGHVTVEFWRRSKNDIDDVASALSAVDGVVGVSTAANG